MSNKILSYLFESNAIKFCKENEPFWLTSGKLSPYFFNSQYVYGGEKESTEFLNYITDELKLITDGKANKLDLPKKIFDKVLDKYGVFSACIFTFMCRESIIRYNETVKYL